MEVGGQAFTARVAITEGEERDQIYETFKSSSNNFVKYEQTAQRTIPVIRLIPA